MAIMGAMLLYCLVTTLYSIGVSGVSLTDCDGLICPDNSYCSVSSTTVDGRQQTVRTCVDMGGNVVARSFSSGEANNGNRRSSVVQSSNFVMSGGGGNCIHHTSSINGINTSTYRCSNDDGNAYYVTNTNGLYKNCTTIPVTLDSGVTTMQEHCVPMSPADIQRVKDMEEEIQRKAEEVRQRMEGMAWEMQARNQEMQNRMMQNMQHTLDESMLRAEQAREKMLQVAEDVRQQALDTASRAQARSQAILQRTLENVENTRRNMENTFRNIYW